MVEGPQKSTVPEKFNTKELSDRIVNSVFESLKKQDCLKGSPGHPGFSFRITYEVVFAEIIEYVALLEPDPRE